MAAIISIRKLSKRYGAPRGQRQSAPALDHVDLEIGEGEIFSLLGPNGAGKTTLISILCGLLPPSAGDAVIGGHSVLAEPMAVKRLIGVVPEEIAIYPYLSGRENLRYFGLLYGLEGRELARAVEEALGAIGLADRAGDRVSSYSNGMKRRLNIGVGLLHSPQVVLMDEPTLGLDPQSRRGILDLVMSLKAERGATILYTTHRLDEAQELSDRVAIIHRGRIIALGAPDELVQSLGAGEILRLEVASGPVGGQAVEELRQLSGVSGVIVGADTITMTLAAAADTLPEILRLADRRHLRVNSFTVQKPSLEDVFLRLTGESLAEAGP